MHKATQPLTSCALCNGRQFCVGQRPASNVGCFHTNCVWWPCWQQTAAKPHSECVTCINTATGRNSWPPPSHPFSCHSFGPLREAKRKEIEQSAGRICGTIRTHWPASNCAAWVTRWPFSRPTDGHAVPPWTWQSIRRSVAADEAAEAASDHHLDAELSGKCALWRPIKTCTEHKRCRFQWLKVAVTALSGHHPLDTMCRMDARGGGLLLLLCTFWPADRTVRCGESSLGRLQQQPRHSRLVSGGVFFSSSSCAAQHGHLLPPAKVLGSLLFDQVPSSCCCLTCFGVAQKGDNNATKVPI